VLGLKKIHWQVLPVKAALVSGQGYLHGGRYTMFLRGVPSFLVPSPCPGDGCCRLCPVVRELLAASC